jgi:hypothetical protein
MPSNSYHILQDQRLNEYLLDLQRLTSLYALFTNNRKHASKCTRVSGSRIFDAPYELSMNCGALHPKEVITLPHASVSLSFIGSYSREIDPLKGDRQYGRRLRKGWEAISVLGSDGEG